MRNRLKFPGSLAISAIFFAGCGKMGLPPAGPPSVEVVQVVQKDVPITRDWVATLDGFVNAQIRAQVNGLLLKQNYANGSYVRKDDPLFEIDPRPFQAELDQANGNLQQATANLQRAEAQLGKTQLDVARYTPLAKESAISQQELEDRRESLARQLTKELLCFEEKQTNCQGWIAILMRNCDRINGSVSKDPSGKPAIQDQQSSNLER